MDFEQTFLAWLRTSLDTPIQNGVEAFAFNLYEPAGEPDVKFGIELIGAGFFDEDDADWPCDEVWAPRTRGIGIPLAYSGSTWESCLAQMRALIARILNQRGEAATRLKSVQGIGIGFVDGDLETVWKR